MQMIRNSIKRIDNNIKRCDPVEVENKRLALVQIGLDLRQIECIIDEAYTLRCITYNMYHLLRRWYRKYYDNIIHNIIWL